MRRLWLVLVLLGCGGSQRPDLPEGACSPMPEGEETAPWESRGYALGVPWFAPRRGAERPRVIVQEFSDFECPYCARALPTVDRVLEEYGECVQVVWRHRPLRYHEHADAAARASIEVYRQGGDDAFWRYHDALYADQENLGREMLLRHARAIEGVDAEAVAAVIDGDEHSGVIDRDRAEIDAHDIELGTPGFFVNGVLISGARRFSHFQLQIERALAEQYEVRGDAVGR